MLFPILPDLKPGPQHGLRVVIVAVCSSPRSEDVMSACYTLLYIVIHCNAPSRRQTLVPCRSPQIYPDMITTQHGNGTRTGWQLNKQQPLAQIFIK